MNSMLKRASLVVVVTALLSGVAGCAQHQATTDPAALPTQPVSTSVPSTATEETTTPSATPTESAEPADSTSPSAQPTEAATPTPTPTTAKPLLAVGSTGDKVRELQHRLLQLNWFSGKITDSYGPATKESVQGFQAKRQLPVTGAVDQKTWDTLVAMTKMPTHDEMYNVLKPGPALFSSGDSGNEVRNIQARLKQLDWYSPQIDGVYGPTTVEAVKGFQDKRAFPVTGEVDRRTLDSLTSMTRTPTTEELTNKPPKNVPATGIDPRCMTGRVLCISKTTNRLLWMIDGKVIESYSVRFGSSKTPTREGTFSVYWKSREHVSTIYGSAMPFAMFFDGGQAVHYSSDFAARGYNGASHGCVNVRDYDGIKWLFDTQVKVGDKVVVYR